MIDYIWSSWLVLTEFVENPVTSVNERNSFPNTVKLNLCKLYFFIRIRLLDRYDKFRIRIWSQICKRGPAYFGGRHSRLFVSQNVFEIKFRRTLHHRGSTFAKIVKRVLESIESIVI